MSLFSLPVASPWALSLGVCAVAAALEGLCAGTGVKAKLAEIQQPRPAIPLWMWSIIGLGYYALFAFLLRSILAGPSGERWSPPALLLCVCLLLMNAAWNWIFFRVRNFRLSFLYFLPYALVAVAFGMVLFVVGNPLRGLYLVYLFYLAFAARWAYKVWRLNAQAPVAA